MQMSTLNHIYNETATLCKHAMIVVVSCVLRIVYTIIIVTFMLHVMNVTQLSKFQIPPETIKNLLLQIATHVSYNAIRLYSWGQIMAKKYAASFAKPKVKIAFIPKIIFVAVNPDNTVETTEFNYYQPSEYKRHARAVKAGVHYDFILLSYAKYIDDMVNYFVYTDVRNLPVDCHAPIVVPETTAKFLMLNVIDTSDFTTDSTTDSTAHSDKRVVSPITLKNPPLYNFMIPGNVLTYEFMVYYLNAFQFLRAKSEYVFEYMTTAEIGKIKQLKRGDYMEITSDKVVHISPDNGKHPPQNSAVEADTEADECK